MLREIPVKAYLFVGAAQAQKCPLCLHSEGTESGPSRGTCQVNAWCVCFVCVFVRVSVLAS